MGGDHAGGTPCIAHGNILSSCTVLNASCIVTQLTHISPTREANTPGPRSLPHNAEIPKASMTKRFLHGFGAKLGGAQVT